MRVAALLAALAAALVFGSGASASSSRSPWAAYLAPRGACAHAESRSAAPALQRRAMACLINWTRRRIGARPLSWSRGLATVAETKARVVISCGDFSHYPCGTRWPTAAALTQRQWNVFGENLYAGNYWLRTPRAAMLAWLESPEHRAVLFGHLWSRLGVSIVVAPRLIGGDEMSLWVLEVAGRSR
jgi:uncharacterized protein YkwD